MHQVGLPLAGLPEIVKSGMNSSLIHADTEIELGFTFGNLRLEPDGTLLRGDQALHLAPKELAALRVLLANPNRIVSPSQFKEILWPDVHVTADSVPRCLSSLRSHLGPGVQIRTIYKSGYRLESPVHRHAAAPQDTLPRLAILPFTIGLCVPEHLGPAIAEEAATHLAALQPPIVRVLPRDSILALTALGLAADEIGRKLAADLVLAGTLQASTLFLRLRVEMIRTSDGAQIWFEDLLAPRERPALLVQRLLDRLANRLGGRVPLSLSASIEDVADEESAAVAFDAFLLGRFEAQSGDPNRMSHAIELLRKAADFNRDTLAAHLELVQLTIDQCLFGYSSPLDAADQIRPTADSIPETAPSSSAILPALGWIMFHVEHQLPFALRMLNGESPVDHSGWPTELRVMLALSRRRFDEAEIFLDHALRDDPFAPTLHILLAWTHHLAGDTKTSLNQAQQCLDLFPRDERAQLCAAIIFAFNYDSRNAADLAHDVSQRRPNLDIAAAVEAYALARAGRRKEATTILERLQWSGRERYVLRAFTAAAYAELGDIDGAIAELQAAEQARCPWFFQTLADPRLKSLHGNCEFIRMRQHLESMEAAVSPKHASFA